MQMCEAVIIALSIFYLDFYYVHIYRIYRVHSEKRFLFFQFNLILPK